LQVLQIKKEEEEKRKKEEEEERARLEKEREQQRKNREREMRLKARQDEEVFPPFPFGNVEILLMDVTSADAGVCMGPCLHALLPVDLCPNNLAVYPGAAAEAGGRAA
jgi:hypothetical protein